MRRLFVLFVCLGLLLFGQNRFLGALEVELTGGINNLTFHPDRVTAHGQSKNYKLFQDYPYGYGDFSLKGDILESVGFEVQASRDNILRNSLNGRIKSNLDYINFEFGPFIGMGDKFEKPELGIMGGMELAYPGIAFLALNGSATLGAKYEFLGNNTRETAEIKLGFWLPNVIPSFSFNTKSYINRPEDYLEIRDELVRMVLGVDFFVKNVPLLLRIDTGYEILTRSYKRGNYNGADEINAFFAGFEVRWQTTKTLCIITALEMPFYSSTVGKMENPDVAYFLYKFHGGIAYTFY